MTDIAYQIIAGLVVLVIAMPVHECAHGLVSYWQGDPTAKMQGRLTLNPIKHLSLLGSILILVAGFGWAKPVPVDPRYYKNPKAGMALTALAGPLANLLLAHIFYAIYRVVYYAAAARNVAESEMRAGLTVLIYIIVINASLAVFNLLPIPPLDGSRMFLVFLPEEWYFKVMQYEQYIAIGMMALVFSGALDGILGAAREGVLSFVEWSTRYVDFFLRLLAG